MSSVNLGFSQHQLKAPVSKYGNKKSVAVDGNLARHWLYARRPEGSDLPDAVTRTYKAALKMLEQMRDGMLSIGDPEHGPATPEPGEMKVRARPNRFDSSLLDRYG